MSEPTKGPWEVGDPKRGDNPAMIYADDALGSRVADCSTHGHGITREEAKANARLIALAPEMRDLLREFASNGCLLCGRTAEAEGHTPACRLGNLLKKVRAE